MICHSTSSHGSRYFEDESADHLDLGTHSVS